MIFAWLAKVHTKTIDHSGLRVHCQFVPDGCGGERTDTPPQGVGSERGGVMCDYGLSRICSLYSGFFLSIFLKGKNKAFYLSVFLFFCMDLRSVIFEAEFFRLFVSLFCYLSLFLAWF